MSACTSQSHLNASSSLVFYEVKIETYKCSQSRQFSIGGFFFPIGFLSKKDKESCWKIEKINWVNYAQSYKKFPYDRVWVSAYFI